MQSMKLEQGLGLLFSNHKGSTSACLFKVIILSFFHSTIKIKGDNTHIKMAILIFYEYFCYISILYNFSPKKTFTYVSISSCYQRLLSVLLWQPNGIVTVVPSKARFFLSLKYFPLKKFKYWQYLAVVAYKQQYLPTHEKKPSSSMLLGDYKEREK